MEEKGQTDKRRTEKASVILTVEQIEQIVKMIENASFKGSSASDVFFMLEALKNYERLGKGNEEINTKNNNRSK